MRTPAMKDGLQNLENRKVELSSAVAAAPATAVRIHPNLAEIYRGKVARLHEELDRPELREEASTLIRGLIEEIRLVPVDGKLEIELAGHLAGILALTNGTRRRNGRGLQVTLVAGARNQGYLYGLIARLPMINRNFAASGVQIPKSPKCQKL